MCLEGRWGGRPGRPGRSPPPASRPETRRSAARCPDSRPKTGAWAAPRRWADRSPRPVPPEKGRACGPAPPGPGPAPACPAPGPAVSAPPRPGRSGPEAPSYSCLSPRISALRRDSPSSRFCSSIPAVRRVVKKIAALHSPAPVWYNDFNEIFILFLWIFQFRRRIM